MIPDGPPTTTASASPTASPARGCSSTPPSRWSPSTPPCGDHATMSNCATGADVASYLTGTGYLDATTTSVTACATAQSQHGPAVPHDLRAQWGRPDLPQQRHRVLRGHQPTAGSGAATPTTAPRCRTTTARGTPAAGVGATNTTDPLAVALLDAVGRAGGLTLGDYISSWKSLVSAEISKHHDQVCGGSRAGRDLDHHPTDTGGRAGREPHLRTRPRPSRSPSAPCPAR